MRTTQPGGILLVVVALALLWAAPRAFSETTDHIEQHGVTFTFDAAYEYGTFANGDYWVVTGGDGAVTITGMPPAFDGKHHGWEVNPDHIRRQGFDTRVHHFDASRVPDLPYDASAGESVVKAISVDLDKKRARPALRAAVVLTVLAQAPPGGGERTFRPPYFGADKPLYSTDDLHPEKLPGITAPGVRHVPSLDWVERRFRRVWLDHKTNWSGRHMHPAENMPEYGAGIARDTGKAALRLMMDDTVDKKMPALVNYVQLGIDLYHMRRGGQKWPPNGGHCSGRKLPIAFAGALLENEDMKRVVREAPDPTVFQEDSSVYYSPTAKMVLWGQPMPERQYWSRLCNDRGSKTAKDPYGYIDGGMQPGASYQACCNSNTWKATALCLHLMPELRGIWNYEPFLDYEDRWVNFGAWSRPDPYALDCDDPGSKDTNPADGTGRFPEAHAKNADGGAWTSRFAGEMWQALRPGDAAGMPAILPYEKDGAYARGGHVTFTDSVEVTLESSPRTPGCELRYTLDGSTPTKESTLYEKPFEITETTTVKARAFKDGLYESAVNTATFETGGGE